jgi:hypothetical protein
MPLLVEADTKTSSEVHSPTSTSTSTKAAGNITVTGGAGTGNTSVTITLPKNGLASDQNASAVESIAGHVAFALQMQEAAVGDLSSKDTAQRISDAVSDAHKGSGNYGYYIDHFGDDDSGDVVYSCNGSTMQCPYEMDSSAGASKAVLNMDAAKAVKGRTVYEPVGDEDDHYAAMSEAFVASNIYTDLPLYERFISKDERGAAAPEDFAGKGKSYPILKPADVQAAVHAMGRAGTGNYDAGTLKRNIIRIAKAKGWGKYLPQAWQGGDSDAAKEAAQGGHGLRLVESAATLEAFEIQEAAREDYEIKLIAPGAGAMAYYPAEVLKRDGPKAFPAETKVYLNHQTKAQEAEGPGNRDVNRLAGVLATPAEWKESHPKGPGLFARLKPFADHAGILAEKAKYLAMSICASGDQAIESSGRRQFRAGLPVLASLHEANPAQNRNSVDIVPVGGAGGMILTEAAGAANPNREVSEMDANEVKLLRESLATQAALTSGLVEKELRREAIAEGARILRDVSLPATSKEYVIETVLREALPKKDGALDITKFTEAVNGEARRFAGAIGAGPRVTGMGGAPVVQIDAAESARRVASEKAEENRYKESFAFLMGGNEKLAEVALAGRPQEGVV